jgi:hypothetical protein
MRKHTENNRRTCFFLPQKVQKYKEFLAKDKGKERRRRLILITLRKPKAGKHDEDGQI